MLLIEVSFCKRKLSDPLENRDPLSKLYEAKNKGRPVPLPQAYTSLNTQSLLDKNEFEFKFENKSVICDVIYLAFTRYAKIMFDPLQYRINEELLHTDTYKNTYQVRSVNSFQGDMLESLTVNVHQPCEDYPQLESDESYTLKVSSTTATIEANSAWGALRALETFSQLLIENEFGELLINHTHIHDFPRFNHRGVLLDTSRHFISKNIIKIHLEAMAANKMNVFHWHIVDDPSFPYQSYTFPDLSEKGAFDPFNHIYTQADIKEIIEFSRQRGIRVVAEFDTPGHALSWGKSLPILTPCYKNGKPDGSFGPMDPTNNKTFEVLESFVEELVNVFPDKYLHLGGDEVDFSCWKTNPDIKAFMEKSKYNDDYSKIEQFYIQNLLNIVKKVSPKTGYVIWQEVVDNNVEVKSDTVVEVWKDPWPQEMDKVTKHGYRTILSTCWYLNYISYGSDWENYYKCEPLDFNGTDTQKDLVIGGEACMWGEYVDGTNVIPRTWPRTVAVAERLWSAKDVTDIPDAADRIEQQRCRMIKRGINAEPDRKSVV